MWEEEEANEGTKGLLALKNTFLHSGTQSFPLTALLTLHTPLACSWDPFL
jgi:hypothetical protein